jgi:hypothetical protein
MPATVTSITPKRTAGPVGRRSRRREPFRDNPRLILAGIGVLIAVLVALLAIANGTSRFHRLPERFVLYALSVADLTMLVALVFVLARTSSSWWWSGGRRCCPPASGRSWSRCCSCDVRLAVLVLIVGSELIHERGPLVQHADGRDSLVCEQDRQRLLPGTADGRQRSCDENRAGFGPSISS